MKVQNWKHLGAGRCVRSASLILGLSVVLGACASYTEETRQMRSLYRQGSYERALEKLEKSSVKEENKNRLLYRMEKAQLLDRMGKSEDARKLFIEADKLVDELYTTSISKTAVSFLVNDASSDYEGEDFEKVAIHTMAALSFLGDGQLPSARVEARAINLRLDEINQKYGTERKNQYQSDAFAQVLSALIYEAKGEWDDAIIDFRKALGLYEGPYKHFYSGSLPENIVVSYCHVLAERQRNVDLKEVESRHPAACARGKKLAEQKSSLGSLVVIHEIGNIAVKINKEFILPISDQIVRFSFPVISKSSLTEFGRTGIEVEGVAFSAGENMQDFNAIAHATLEDKRLRMVAKQTARLLAKARINREASNRFGPLVGLAVNIFNTITETGDTRSWTTLPESISVTRIPLAPGTHKIKIFNASRVSEARTVEIQPGKVLLIRDKA